MSLLIFMVVLSLLIVVHEFGHFIVAKKSGVKVERFALGFGPKLFSTLHDGTEFALCLFPLGGYVKMAGDERASCQGTTEEYYSQTPGKRALIVVMGPVVNYLLAYLCFAGVFIFGYPTLSAKVGEVLTGYPAQAAGLQTGDEIIRINDIPMQNWEEVQRYISSSPAEILNVSALRQGVPMERAVTPREEVLKNIFGQTERVRVIGIKPKDEIIILKYGMIESFGKAAVRLWDITAATYKALFRMMTGAMSPQETMTGPIGIFYIIKKAAALGFSYLLYIVGIISASLAIFNLLPLPVLDGGHLFLLGIEKIRGRTLSPRVDDVITRVGFSLILCLAVFVFYNDFARFGLLDKIMGWWQKFRL